MKHLFGLLALTVLSPAASATPLKLNCSAGYTGPTDFTANRHEALVIEGHKRGILRLIEKDFREPYAVAVSFTQISGASYQLSLTVGGSEEKISYQTNTPIVVNGTEGIVLDSVWYPAPWRSPLHVDCRLAK